MHNRGGDRTGSGRPKIDPKIKKVKTSVILKPEHIAKMKAQIADRGLKSISALLEELLDKHL